MILTDADGNDLGSQTEMFSSLRIYGELSEEYASTQSIKEDGMTYIRFNADLPDERDINYNEDKSTGTGTSTMTINADGKTARLTFAFETTSNGEQMYGGNAIHIISARLGNKVIGNEEDGDMVIVLVVDGGGLSLSEIPLTFEESSAAIANWWNKSSEDKTNLSLAHLQDNDLIPIYKLIPDETKRAEVQRAVKAYIHSHQLN